MSSTTHVSQVKRLAFLLASNDGREGSVVAAERYHQTHIEKTDLTVAEIDFFSDLIENSNRVTNKQYADNLILARFIAEALAMNQIHFLFVIARCYETITVIANHYTGSYDDYPIVNVQGIFNQNLAPRAKWGTRLDSAVYDRMASLLVALYLEKSLRLDADCLLRVDLYREVIEPLVMNEVVVRKNLSGIFYIIDTLVAVKSSGNSFFNPQNIVLGVHDLIGIANLLEAHGTNLSRIASYVMERGNLDLPAIEAHLSPVPALTGGGI